METGMKSHVGAVRQINEDCGKVIHYSHDWVLAIVADGMGGHQAGDVASKMAVEAIEKEMAFIDEKISEDQAAGMLQRALEIANRQVFEYALANEECRGMGTTVAAALLSPNWGAFCHIGDSRIYKWAEGKLLLLTEDHSLVNELQKSGQITEEEARLHPQRNVLVRALGTEQTVRSDMQISTWGNEETLLLCSDGLTNKVTDEEISSILGNGRSAQPQAEELVQRALDAGGDDNITVVIVRNTLAQPPSGERGASS